LAGLSRALALSKALKSDWGFHEHMPEKKQGLGPVKRFGVRYGTTVKVKRAAIEVMQKNSTKCPYCLKDKAERKTKGVWHCLKCNNTFTGQAYTFSAKSTLTSLPPVEQVLAEIQKPAAEEAEEEFNEA
jgi:ribosomal protein L37AE/L43A